MVFRDPCFLDFLGVTGHHVEKDVEEAILRELEAFILELGTDFAFVARQKRITVDSEDYYLDLLFYHRRLRCLVAIDLKLGKFQAADKGQMELYLRWLEQHDTQSGEEPPIGLILCADKSEEHVELLRLKDSSIRVRPGGGVLSSLVLDTHAVIWFLDNSPRLSQVAREAIRATITAGDPVFISAVTVAEMTYLARNPV